MKWGWYDMPKISARVSFDTVQAVARIRSASNGGLQDMGQEALTDANMHAPRDQGDLVNSGISNSDLEGVNNEITLRWATPYSQYLWNGDVMYGNPTNRSYGPKKISFTSALAQEEWAKYAKEAYGEDWKMVYTKGLKRRLNQ